MKKSNFNIIYFLLLFLALNYGFYVYVGITTPGGKFFSPFLHKYLNVPEWLSEIVVKTTRWVLQVMGYSTYQKTPLNVTITKSRGVNIAWGCLGIGVMVAWLAFIMAHKDKLAYKLKWVIGGIVVIFIVNILRVIFIILSLHYNWSATESLDAHKVFNILTYVIIIILMLLFVIFYTRKNNKSG